MKRIEIGTRLPDVPGAAHDEEPEQTAAWRDGLAYRDRRKPEQHGRKCEAIAQELRSRKPETIGEFAEDTEAAEADRRTDDKRDAGRVSVRCGRRHPVILGMRRYWTITGAYASATGL